MTRQDADVSHPDHRKPIESLRADCGSRMSLADGVGGFAGGKVAGEKAVGDDGRAAGGDTFVVVSESAEAGTMLLAAVGDYVDDVAAVAKLAKFVKREEGRTGEVSFHSQNPVEFNGVPNGFVNLQAHLRAVENEVERAFRTLVGFEQCNGFFAHTACVLEELQFFDEFVAFGLVLVPKGIW